MPSVASEVHNTLAARAHPTGNRKVALGDGSEAQTPFADLLDDATPPATPPTGLRPISRPGQAESADKATAANSAQPPKPDPKGAADSPEVKDAEPVADQNSAGVLATEPIDATRADGSPETQAAAKKPAAADPASSSVADQAAGPGQDKAMAAAEIAAPVATPPAPPPRTPAPPADNRESKEASPRSSDAIVPVASPVVPIAAADSPPQSAAAGGTRPLPRGAARPAAPQQATSPKLGQAADTDDGQSDTDPAQGEPLAQDAAATGKAAPQTDGAGAASKANAQPASSDFHRTLASLLGKPDADTASTSKPGDDTAATQKAGSDAVQNLGVPAPAATTSTAAVSPNVPTQLSAAAVPLGGIAVAIVKEALSGNSHFQIRLDPPELGRIEVRLSVDHDGRVTSHLVADRPDTLDLLRRDAGDLQRALQQAGLETSDNALEFSLRQQAFAQHDAPAQAAAPVVLPDDDSAPLEALRQGYGRLLGLGGGLDIRV